MSLSAVHGTLSSLKSFQADIGTGMDIVTDVAMDLVEAQGKYHRLVMVYTLIPSVSPDLPPDSSHQFYLYSSGENLSISLILFAFIKLHFTSDAIIHRWCTCCDHPA